MKLPVSHGSPASSVDFCELARAVTCQLSTDLPGAMTNDRQRCPSLQAHPLSGKTQLVWREALASSGALPPAVSAAGSGSGAWSGAVQVALTKPNYPRGFVSSQV